MCPLRGHNGAVAPSAAYKATPYTIRVARIEVQTHGRVPSPPKGDSPSMMGAPESHPYPLLCAPLSGLWPSSLPSPRPVLPRGPHFPRGRSAPGRGARRRFAAPFRALAPRFAPRGRGGVRAPRLPRSGSCAALRASAASRWPRCASGPALRCGGLPDRSALRCAALAVALRGFLAGSPPAPFLPRRLPAGGRLAAFGRLLPASPPRLFLRAVLRPAWAWDFFSPPRSPPGSARSRSGASPPLWGAFFAPLSRAPRRAPPAPGAPFSVRFTFRKL